MINKARQVSVTLGWELLAGLGWACLCWAQPERTQLGCARLGWDMLGLTGIGPARLGLQALNCAPSVGQTTARLALTMLSWGQLCTTGLDSARIGCIWTAGMGSAGLGSLWLESTCIAVAWVGCNRRGWARQG